MAKEGNMKIRLNASMDRITNFIRNTKKTGADKRTDIFLKARVKLLDSYWGAYQNINEQWLQSASEAELQVDAYFTEDTFSNIECSYIETLCWLNEELAKVCSTTESDSKANTNFAKSASDVSLRLPKINLPIFSGSYVEWPSFCDTFHSLIHVNKDLPGIQKMHYLKAAVSRDAAKLIDHLAVTSENYATAWKALCSRYDNKRLLVNSNLHALMTIPSMVTESSNEIRRVLDGFSQAVRSLENLKRPVDQWNDWLVHILSNKLDQDTRKDWETTISSCNEIPTLESLNTFLEGRLHTLNVIKSLPGKETKLIHNRSDRFSTRSHHISSSSPRACICCQDKHPLLFCPKFRAKSVSDRYQFIQDKKLCSNCLRGNHIAKDCPSPYRCKQCNSKHHTMLHQNQFNQPNPMSIEHAISTKAASCDTTDERQHATSPEAYVQSSYTTSTNVHTLHKGTATDSVLLATALVSVKAANGRIIVARALLDQGSESNFISSALAKLLCLPKRATQVSVMVIGGQESKVAESYVYCDIISIVDPNKKFYIQALVLPTLTHFLPSQSVQRWNWRHLEGLDLADRQFHKSSSIDLILGVEVYSQIIENEIRRGPIGTPVAQRTALGWIISGRVSGNRTKETVHSLHCSVDNDLRTLIGKFWEINEVPTSIPLTPADEHCEQFFHETHKRNDEGRYIVRLPFKSPPSGLGKSRSAALASLYRMERHFSEDKELYRMYKAFMDEYLSLNHMQCVSDDTPNYETARSYYLPHHAVLKPTSSTTKLRVVFNASQRTSSGMSLNDVLHVGPKLQKDVSEIILKWRLYPIVFSADIEKMYRQILIDKQDAEFQNILWRNTPNEPVKTYILLTVTYGTACAPYLACKTLQQLSSDHAAQFPNASTILREHFYVDDALFGSYDPSTTLHIRDELRNCLSSAGFNIRKWLSNHPDMLHGIPAQDKEVPSAVKFVHNDEVKALGIMWSPQEDHFTFRFSLNTSPTTTKRQILSDISRLYDPLGWLLPNTIKAKIFLQRICMLGCGWDDELPSALLNEWVSYQQDVQNLNNIHVPRWIRVTKPDCVIELHGFSDSSNLAYGAAVYVRVLNNINDAYVSLAIAKSRVSPLKTLSIPRLELCGATLLADLISNVQAWLNLKSSAVHAWTDSTIVLAWIKEFPSRWKTFVANRVSKIQQQLPNVTWHHINSDQNPADCLTRGVSSHDLKSLKLWWNGPTWLCKHSTDWYKASPNCSSETILEEKQQTIVHVATKLSVYMNEILHRYSDLLKLLRITAYCHRFAINANSSKAERTNGPLTKREISTALVKWITVVQQHSFAADIKALSSKLSLSTSGLISLNPFLDDQYILRVGGRLKHSSLCYSEKHPIILPKDGHFTQLIIHHAHTKSVHGGVQLTLRQLRTQYWIIHARSKVRQIIQHCVTCHRYRAKMKWQIMGDLPVDRIRPSKPFLKSGVDFAGPFNLKTIKGRGQKFVKGYIAVFICLCTRAIHLEVVLDLSSEAFLAAFKRFVSRRGRCANLYSDNATNFQGANKELKLHLRQLRHEISDGSALRQELLDDGTEWHFIPPSAPHFGGLWEAGVKSLKHHLRRKVGEACLNSRPLHPMSDDPDDLAVITPGHFLVGESLLAIPQPSLAEIPANRLNRWQMVQQLYESLWKVWHKDYLHNLQQRNKWCTPERPISQNDLVLIRDDRLPPAKWSLGRVTILHPGQDGHVRVATVKYKNGEFLRPITKLSVLPLESKE